MGQGEVGGVTHKVTCTWWLLGLAVKAPWLGPGWANSCPGYMERLRKHYSHVVEDSFLAEKAAWAMSRCLTTKSADYCVLVNEWAWFKVMSLLVKSGSGLGFSFGVRA